MLGGFAKTTQACGPGLLIGISYGAPSVSGIFPTADTRSQLPSADCGGGALWRLRTPPACRKRSSGARGGVDLRPPGSQSAPPAVAVSVLWQNCFFYEDRGWPSAMAEAHQGRAKLVAEDPLGTPRSGLHE